MKNKSKSTSLSFYVSELSELFIRFGFIFFIFLFSCSSNNYIKGKHPVPKKNYFIGRGFGENEVSAINNAKNNGIEKIIESMGVNVEINSEMNEFYEESNGVNISKSNKKNRVKIFSKANFKFRVKDIFVEKRFDKYYAEVGIPFNKNDYQKIYRFYLTIWNKTLSQQNNNFNDWITTLKLIRQIDNKLKNQSGLFEMDEWKEYQKKRIDILNKYRKLPINFRIAGIKNNNFRIKINAPFIIKNGNITLKIGDSLLHKKIYNNYFDFFDVDSSVHYIFGYWKEWCPNLEQKFNLLKNNKIKIKVKDVSKDFSGNFGTLLKKKLTENDFIISDNANYTIIIKTKVKFIPSPVALKYFLEGEFEVKLYHNKKNILEIHFPNYEYPGKKYIGNTKNEVIKKTLDFRNYPQSEWVIKNIAMKIKKEIKKEKPN